ncbi:MAG TPA: TCR/Tet family MFS transporter [Candidatus Dormibacteraeota bacterium]|nr:TCR/Tet family MFS transporter [Candidatus Dormibacteraeota bacterium]
MSPPRRRAALVFIVITVVLDFLAIGVIVPVLPTLVVDFLHGDTARAAEVYGLFGTVWALMQFVFSPVLGALSDRFGRRPVILISNFGLGLDYIIMATAPSLTWLFVGRVLSGITAASYATALAYIADVAPPEQRARGFGLLGAAFSFGFIIGPAVGGLLGTIGPRLPFWFAGGLSLANALYGLLVLPESLPPARRAPFRWRGANPIGALTLLRSHPELLGLAGAFFLYSVAHDVLPSTFVLYASYRYGWSQREVGFLLAGIGICGMIVQAGLAQPAVTRLGERRVLLGALLCGTLGFSIYGLAPRGALLWLGVPLQSLWGLSSVAAQGLMTRRVDPSSQGQLQGATASLRGIGGMIGPGLFTLTFAHFISPDAARQVPGASFFLAAALLVASAALAARVTRASA